MVGHLESFEAKLLRASEHLKALEDEIEAWFKSSPYRIARHVNVERTRYSLVVSLVSNPPLERWSLIVGDCAHNLRSALDHLVYAIATKQSPTGRLRSERTIAFPISDSVGDFNRARWRIKEVSEPVRTAVETLQPYNRKHATLPPLLGVLRDLDDADKHRLLQLAFSTVSQWKLNNVEGLIPEQLVRVSFYPGDVKEGTEIVALSFDQPTPDVSYEYDGEFVIALGHAIGPAGIGQTEVSALLHALDAEVRDVVSLLQAAAG